MTATIDSRRFVNKFTALLATTLAIALAGPAWADGDDDKPKKKKKPAAKKPVEDKPAEDADDDERFNSLEVIPGVEWVKGPATGVLGNQAEIVVPKGYMFTQAEGTRTILEAMGNLTGSDELGLFAPVKGTDWFIVFSFDEVGYVKDDEKDKLDADALMKTLKEGNKAGNEERKRRQMDTLELVGWERPPQYNNSTKNLEWCTRLRAKGGDTANYNIRILGRKGVMSANMVLSPEDVNKYLPKVQSLLGDFSYTDGQRYADWKSGDKVAEYGLTALIAGGGAALALKTGLFQKLWKVILFGIAGIAALFKKIFGGGSKSE